MTKKELILELNSLSALRKNRWRVANLVLENKNNFKPLLEIVFDVDNKDSIKAAWVMEFVCHQKLEWLYDSLDYFTNNCKNVHFGSAVRPMAKICQMLVVTNDKTPVLNLTNKHKELITEIAFDWLISKHKVAVKAYSMLTLYILGKKIDWVHPELKLIITQNSSAESAAYKSRGKITLVQINKFKR